jgi:transposase
MSIFDFEAARKFEAERRLKLLDDLVKTDYDPGQLRNQARLTRLPRKVLLHWLQTYQRRGLEGLIPEWTELDPATYGIIQARYEQLGDLADNVMITKEQVAKLAQKNNWSERTTERWLVRYRIGGLWGLAPRNDPGKPQRRPKEKFVPRELATLSEAELEVAYERRQMLGNLAKQDRVINEEAQVQAARAGVSVRTLWNYLKAYRDFGLVGLAPKPRSDKGRHHGVSERVVQLVAGIRLSHPDWSIQAVWEAACRKVAYLNEPEPSEYQVRSICDHIPAAVKLLADGRKDAFRNKYRITYPIRFEQIVYQIDHTQIDVLVKDIRSPKYRTPTGEIRPWLTLCMDSQSRLVMAARFGYDRPDRFVVAAAIRDALLVSETKSYGGLPNEIWVDNGKELVARHVQQLTRELGIMLEPCLPGQPQHKGIVERFFETLNTRLWSRLPGYVSSNVVERNPNAKAALTLSELVAEFWPFIEKYHQEVHSETGNTPLQYWSESCFAEPVDPRLLDTLLKEPENRRVIKEGVKHAGQVYWHPALASLVGENVLIRAEPLYMSPEAIEVYYGGGWICTAFAIDSKIGRSVTPQQIAEAQREQREHIRQKIRRARAAVKDADRQIEELKGSNNPEDGAENSPSPPQTTVDKPARISPAAKKSKKRNILDHLAGLEGEQ